MLKGCLQLVAALFVLLLLVGIFAGEGEQPPQGTAHLREQPSQEAARLEHAKQAERRAMAAKGMSDRLQKQHEERQRKQQSRLTPPAEKRGSLKGQSETCGQVIGQTAKDLRNLQEFCSDYIYKGAVSGSYAADTLLWIKVPHEMAEVMRIDRLRAEQLVRSWMRGWKNKTGRKAVTVTVEWKDVEIAVGQTSVWSGDEVTIR